MTTTIKRYCKAASAIRLALTEDEISFPELKAKAKAFAILAGLTLSDADMDWSLQYLKSRGEAVHVRFGAMEARRRR
jgi:hypothetical protein